MPRSAGTINASLCLCHTEHMKTISIRELHLATGKWIRDAKDQKIVNTERGHPIATIGPFSANDVGTSFANRQETSAFKNLPKVGFDSASLVSEDRDRK